MSETINWLSTEKVIISKKLADLMAAFEFHNCLTIDTAAADFIKELVIFTKEQLDDHDNFYRDSDKPGVIVNLIYENSASNSLQAAIDQLEDVIHTIQLTDEIDNMMVEIINCAVQSCDITEV